MALAVKHLCFLQRPRTERSYGFPKPLAASGRSRSPMASLSVAPAVGISETFSRLRKQGKVAVPRQSRIWSKIWNLYVRVVFLCCFLVSLGLCWNPKPLVAAGNLLFSAFFLWYVVHLILEGREDVYARLFFLLLGGKRRVDSLSQVGSGLVACFL